MNGNPKYPLDVFHMPNGDVLLLPAVWPVRLTPQQRKELCEQLCGEPLEQK
ncbi:hypothetical protein ABZW49_10480 [Nonomuraea wenchangensis]